MLVDQAKYGTELGQFLGGKHILLQQADLIHGIAVKLGNQRPLHFADGQKIKTLGSLPIFGVGRDNDCRGVYGSRLGLAKHHTHVFDNLRIPLDKIIELAVGAGKLKKSCPVRRIVQHSGDVVDDVVRYSVHPRHIFQGSLQLHGCERARRKNPLTSINVVSFFKVILDFLPAV